MDDDEKQEVAKKMSSREQYRSLEEDAKGMRTIIRSSRRICRWSPTGGLVTLLIGRMVIHLVINI